MSGSNVEDHLWNEKGIITWNSIAFCKIPDFFLESIDSTDTAGKYNTHAVAVNIILRNACIRNCLITGNKCRLRETVKLAGFFFIQKAERIEIFQLARKTGFEFRRIKKSN